MRDVVKDVERDLAEAGRDRSAFRITALAIAAIGDDLDVACGLRSGRCCRAFPQTPRRFLARGVVDPDELIQ